MSNKELNNLGILIGIAGVGYAIYVTHKMNKLCDKIDRSVDEVSRSTSVDISKSMVDKAVEKAVDREVGSAVVDATTMAVNSIKNDIHSQIKTAVDSEYSTIRETVSTKVSEEVAKIDMKKLSMSVSDKAEAKILSKFDDNLDHILEKFNHELTSISKIYKSISDTMSNNNNREKETILRIS